MLCSKILTRICGLVLLEAMNLEKLSNFGAAIGLEVFRTDCGAKNQTFASPGICAQKIAPTSRFWAN